MKHLLIVAAVIVVACGPSQRADTPIIPAPPKDENNIPPLEDDGPNLCTFISNEREWINDSWETVEIFNCVFDSSLSCNLFRWRNKAYIDCE